MPKTNFYLKSPSSKTESLVFLYFSYDGKRLKYSINLSVKPKDWNEKDQRIKKSHPGSSLTTYLKIIKSNTITFPF
jgi:hypothetical protein